MANRKDELGNSFFSQNAQSKEMRGEVVDLSFVNSKSIRELEEGIQRSVKSGVKIQLAVCIALYRIGSENLFAEYGLNSLHEYIKKQTYLPYSTAQEYYYIGKYWLELQEDLKQIGFTEEDGLTKLKLIPKNMTIEEKKLVLEHLKKDSSRQFKQFVRNFKMKNQITDRSEANKELQLDDNVLIDEFIKYYNSRSKNTTTAMNSNLKAVQNFIEYLVDKGLIDKKHYNYMIDQIK